MKSSPASHEPAGMVMIPAGHFLMGSDHHYPEEKPVRQHDVNAFWMDRSPVTNAEFSKFVDDTRFVTTAETIPDAALYPGLLPEMAIAGSIVFQRPMTQVPYHPSSWWNYLAGAHWRTPYGICGPKADELPNHPAVHISLSDAMAYCAWAGKTLPTEIEWEYAARGGLQAATYSWGDTLEPDGKAMANYWRSGFPYRGATTGDAPYTTSVGSYPANGYDLLDIIGNVWEWTATAFNSPTHIQRSCCSAPEKQKPDTRMVLKGGSHLCAPEYCQRYRPAARIPQEADSGMSHIGFRCIVRV